MMTLPSMKLPSSASGLKHASICTSLATLRIVSSSTMTRNWNWSWVRKFCRIAKVLLQWPDSVLMVYSSTFVLVFIFPSVPTSATVSL